MITKEQLQELLFKVTFSTLEEQPVTHESFRDNARAALYVAMLWLDGLNHLSGATDLTLFVMLQDLARQELELGRKNKDQVEIRRIKTVPTKSNR